MRFDRESYRKLYVAESAEHRLLSLFARGLRDYLLRFATEDGTLLPTTTRPADDLARVLGAATNERKPIGLAVAELLRIGYLSHEGGRLWITRYVEAQEARSPGALRQQRYRDANRDVTPPVTRNVTVPVTSNVTSNRRDLAELADESSPRAHTHEVAKAPEPEPEPRLTSCPLDLSARVEKLGVLAEFCEKYRAEPEQIREVIREFVSYWTIGGGMGRSEANWPKKLREHLRRSCEKPGGLAAPGALEHATRSPKRGRGGPATALAEVLPAPYHEAWKEPDWMKS
jgi:hypothetical protein